MRRSRVRRLALLVPVLAIAATAHAQPPPGDSVGNAARLIARRVTWVPNHRARQPLGVWREDAGAVWSIRPERECLAELERAEIPFRRQDWTPTPVPTPVVLTGPIEGVRFEKTRDVPLIVACELAVRLPTLARVLAAHGIVRADVLSAYRIAPRESFHSVGLGLDLSVFERTDGTVLSVLDDYEPALAHTTCDAPREATEAARTLREIACEIAASGVFSTVLTPSYPGHENHFHLDVRPDDPRIFVR